MNSFDNMWPGCFGCKFHIGICTIRFIFEDSYKEICPCISCLVKMKCKRMCRLRWELKKTDKEIKTVDDVGLTDEGKNKNSKFM